MIVTSAIYFLLHVRITCNPDRTLITVPITAKPPSFSEAMKAAEKKATQNASAVAEHTEDKEDEKKEQDKYEMVTTLEYDLRQLNASRRSWITNACLLAAIHYKMESVSPLIMSSVMGIIRLISDDPLFKLYILGASATAELARPFKTPESPLTALLKEMAPKPDKSSPHTSDATLADPDDDAESEDAHDSPPGTPVEIGDDHIKSDFHEDET